MSYWCAACGEHIVVPEGLELPRECSECRGTFWASCPPISSGTGAITFEVSGALPYVLPRKSKPKRGRMRSQAHLRVIRGGLGESSI
jgi:hypothetical protein